MMSKLDEREKRAAEARQRKSFVQSIVDDKQQEKKFKQRSYYLTDDLIKAITIKTAESNMDKSEVVREALKIYLADILEKF